jgi:hypothetical protein
MERHYLHACTDPVDTKSMVLEHHAGIESLCSTNGTGKWHNKIDLLINHFNQPLIITSAELKTNQNQAILQIQLTTHSSTTNMPSP